MNTKYTSSEPSKEVKAGDVASARARRICMQILDLSDNCIKYVLYEGILIPDAF